jgi:hypothetical protein
LGSVNPKDLFATKNNQSYSAKDLSLLQNSIYNHTLQNATAEYIHMKLNEPRNRPAPIENLEVEAVQDLCGSSAACGVEAHQTIQHETERYLEPRLGQTIPSQSAEDIKDRLNAHIDQLNSKIANVDTKARRSWWMLYKNAKIEDADKASFEDYRSQFAESVQSEYGNLFLTPSVQSKMGAPRNLSSALFTGDLDGYKNENGESRYKLERHNQIQDPMTITQSYGELRSMMVEQVGDLHKMNDAKIKSELQKKDEQTLKAERLADLKKLVITNPVAIAQAVIENPDSAPALCQIISGINQDDLNAEKWNKVHVFGGAGVLAVSTILTGGLGLAGFTTTAAVVGGIGSAAGTAMTTKTFLDMAEARHDARILKNAAVSGSADSAITKDYMAASNEYEAKLDELYKQGALTAAQVVAFHAVRGMGRMSKESLAANEMAAGASQLRNDGRVLEKFYTNATPEELAAVRTSMERTGVSETELVSAVTEGAKEPGKILELLPKMTDEEIAQLEKLGRGLPPCAKKTN